MTIRNRLIFRVVWVVILCMLGSSLFAMDSKVAQDQAQIKKKEDDTKRAIEKVADAIEKHDLAGVQKYIADGGDVNAVDATHRSLLRICSYPAIRNIDAAKLLLERGAKVYNQGDYGPLFNAISSANHAFLELLLKHQNINEMPGYHQNPLTLAVDTLCNGQRGNGQLERLKTIELLKRLGADFNAKNKDEQTPLAVAVLGDGTRHVVFFNLFTAKALVRWGACYQHPRLPIELDILKKNAKDHNDKDEFEAIEMMRSYIDERRVQPPQEATAACLSVLGCSVHKESTSELERAMTDFIQGPETADAMVRDGVKDAIARGSAFQHNQEPMLNWIVGKDDKEPIADETGYTPLLYAVYRGNQKAVKTLLLLDPQLDARTISGQTAQMIADQQFKATDNEVFRTIKEMVNDTIVKRKEQAQQKIKEEQERIKQAEAAVPAQLENIKRAIENDASLMRFDYEKHCWTLCDYVNERTVNKRYDKDLTPLLHAVWLGRTEITGELLKAGAKVDDRDSEYRTPLMRAALSGHVEVVTLLLDHMSAKQIAMTASHGKTAYDLVKEEAARIKKLYEERSLPEYEQKLEKYEQIMMLLDA